MSSSPINLTGSSTIDLSQQKCNVQVCCCDSSGSEYLHQEITFDDTIDILPFVASDGVTSFDVCVNNMTADLDITGQLPTNLPAGSVITVYHNAPSGRIIYDDGKKVHRFVNKCGEQYRMEYTGTKWKLI